MKKLAIAVVLAALISGCGAIATPPMAPAARAGALQAQGAKRAAKKVPAALAPAARWVAANSGGSFWDTPRKHLFPAPDDGNIGTDAFAYADADGQWFADVMQVWCQGHKHPPRFDFDPRTDVLVAVKTSDDEPVVMAAKFDRQTGKGQVVVEAGIVDFTMPQPQFTKFFPRLGNVDEVDTFEVLKAIEARGVDLGI